MHSKTTIVITALVIAFLSGCAGTSSKKEPVVLPEGTLDQTAVVELFEDKTFESVTVGSGRTSTSYYDPNGQIRQVRQGSLRNGYWRVNSSGRMCLQMENHEEKCRIIVLEDGSYKKYVVKVDGQHRHVVSYRRIMYGNPMGL